MATGFIRDAEIAAGLAPFRAMRCDPAPADAKLRKQMREFMSKRAIDLRVSVINEPGIQRNQTGPEVGAPGRAAQPRIPFHAH
jgi:hypothetical protein